jgi:hypothetical protein
MKRLNILDLHRKMNEKSIKTTECFEKVLDICHKKILLHSDKKISKFFFEVPEYIFGLPLFDTNECIMFVMDSLKRNGFIAVYHFPRFIYVSWDLQEIEESKRQSKNQTKNKTQNMRHNPHALDFKYKPSGKLSVDLD